MLTQQEWKINQKKGTSSCSLADIKATGDGTDVKFVITPELVHQIFLEHPPVKKAYEDNVPLKVSQIMFFDIFFR